MKDIVTYIAGNDPSVITLFIKVVLLIVFIIAACIAKKLDAKLNIHIYESVLKQIEYIINSIVVYMNQTTVDNLKENSENGSLDSDDRIAIFNEVKHLVKQSLTVEQVKVLETFYPSLEEALKILIEKAVNNNKTSYVHNINYNGLCDNIDDIITNYDTVTNLDEIKNGSENDDVKTPIETNVGETSETLIAEEPEEKPKKKRTRKTKKTVDTETE